MNLKNSDLTTKKITDLDKKNWTGSTYFKTEKKTLPTSTAPIVEGTKAPLKS